MNSRDRCLAAMNIEEPDVVPLFENWPTHESVLEKIIGKRMLGHPAPIGRLDLIKELEKGKRAVIKKYVHDLVYAHKKGGLDMVCAVVSPGVGFKLNWIDENTFQWGYQVFRFFPEQDTAWYVRGTFKPEYFEEWVSTLDPDFPGIMDSVEETVKLAKKNDLAVIGTSPICFNVAYAMWSLDKLLVCFYRDPSFAKKLMETLINYHIQIAKRIMDYGVDAMLMWEDICHKGGPMISLGLFRRFLSPLYRKFFSVIKKRGLSIHFHSDGNTWSLLDDLVSLGVDGLQGIEEQAGMDIGLLKLKYGEKLSFMGNIDCGRTLLFGTEKDVANEVRDIIIKAAPGGGLLMGSSNTIVPKTPIENFLVMVRATKKYGIYTK